MGAGSVQHGHCDDPSTVTVAIGSYSRLRVTVTVRSAAQARPLRGRRAPGRARTPPARPSEDRGRGRGEHRSHPSHWQISHGCPRQPESLGDGARPAGPPRRRGRRRTRNLNLTRLDSEQGHSAGPVQVRVTGPSDCPSPSLSGGRPRPGPFRAPDSSPGLRQRCLLRIA